MQVFNYIRSHTPSGPAQPDPLRVSPSFTPFPDGLAPSQYVGVSCVFRSVLDQVIDKIIPDKVPVGYATLGGEQLAHEAAEAATGPRTL